MQRRPEAFPSGEMSARRRLDAGPASQTMSRRPGDVSQPPFLTGLVTDPAICWSQSSLRSGPRARAVQVTLIPLRNLQDQAPARPAITDSSENSRIRNARRSVLQRRTAVYVYFSSDQLLLFAFEQGIWVGSNPQANVIRTAMTC